MGEGIIMFSLIHELRRLLLLFRPVWIPCTCCITALAAIDAGLSVIVALVLRDILNTSDGISGYRQTLIFMVFMIFALAVVGPFLHYTLNKNVRKVMTALKIKLMDHIGELPVERFEKKHSGDILTSITTDLQVLEQISTNQLYLLLTTIIMGAASVILMCIIDIRISTVLVLLSVLLSLIYIRHKDALNDLSIKTTEQNNKLTATLGDMVSGLDVVKLFTVKSKLWSIFLKENAELFRLIVRRGKYQASSISMSYVSTMLIFVLVIGASSLLILHSITDFGSIVALLMLQISINAAVVSLVSQITKLQCSMANVKKVIDLLEEPEEKTEDLNAESVSTFSGIEFRSVSFAYQHAENVLDDFNLRIEKGKTTALVGLSGCGKSTVTKLILGFYLNYYGQIFVFGKPVNRYDLKQLRSLIAFVPQDCYVFEGTIEEIIGFGSENPSREEIVSAAKQAHIHDFIESLPRTYETMITEGGQNLSGGQKQRIALARAVIKNAPVMILDEASSALDAESESALQSFIEEQSGKKTMVVITHRLKSLHNTDRICVLSGGKIVEQGSHQSLMEACGLYASIYNTQSREMED
jgi:ABC-type multidrug transport system fused ATPase/permease subunit